MATEKVDGAGCSIRRSAADHVGMQFNGCRVLEIVGKHGHNNVVRVLCHCGNEFTCLLDNLKRGTKSCGCVQLKHARELGLSNVRHGMTETRVHRAWISMKRRCYGKNHPDYKYLGARGIRVCDSWKDSFETFLADMGEPEIGQSIDRIDNNKDYCPDNCRWASTSEQSKNRRKFACPSKRRFTDEQAKSIRDDKAAGLSWSKVSSKYGISISSARNMVAGKSYAVTLAGDDAV